MWWIRKVSVMGLSDLEEDSTMRDKSIFWFPRSGGVDPKPPLWWALAAQTDELSSSTRNSQVNHK